ncbi:hypothetical protein FCJ59_03475 [Cupriavidus basilensis]|nr:hypothetical protein [Cupriavidus basilensis]
MPARIAAAPPPPHPPPHPPPPAPPVPPALPCAARGPLPAMRCPHDDMRRIRFRPGGAAPTIGLPAVRRLIPDRTGRRCHADPASTRCAHRARQPRRMSCTQAPTQKRHRSHRASAARNAAAPSSPP